MISQIFLVVWSLSFSSVYAKDSECVNLRKTVGIHASRFSDGYFCHGTSMGSVSPLGQGLKIKSGDICILTDSSRESILISGNVITAENYTADSVSGFSTELEYPTTFMIGVSRNRSADLVQEIFSQPVNVNLDTTEFFLPVGAASKNGPYLFDHYRDGEHRDIGPVDSHRQGYSVTTSLYQNVYSWPGQENLKWDISDIEMEVTTTAEIKKCGHLLGIPLLPYSCDTETRSYPLIVKKMDENRYSLKFKMDRARTAKSFDCEKVSF